jgi:hypothetical protein
MQRPARGRIPLWRLLAACLAFGAACASAEDPSGALNLSPVVDTLLEPPGGLEAGTVLAGAHAGAFVRNSRADVNLGLQRGAAWFRIPAGALARDGAWVLELRNPRLHDATLYTPAPGGGWHTRSMGMIHPVAAREFHRPAPAFSLALAPDETRAAYLRVQHSGSLRFRLLLWPQQDFLYAMDDWMLPAFGALGALLVMGLYSLCVFVSLREPAYFWHAAMTMLLLLTNAALNGSGPLYLWPGTPWWSVRAVSVLFLLAFPASLMFAVSFLQTADHAPRLARAVHALCAAALAFAALAFGEWLNRDYVTHAVGILMPTVMVVLAAVAARHDRRTALTFMAAHSVVFAGVLALVFLGFGLLPSNPLTEHVMILTFVTACLLWSFALTDRVRRLQLAVRASLEQTVAERTTALNQALTEMETLQRLVPICCSCKKIRNDRGFWEEVERFLGEHTNAQLTHHVCPDCAERLYPQYATPLPEAEKRG